jgi:hypothetical protein
MEPDGILGKLKDALTGGTSTTESDQASQEKLGNIRPASEDPYGDPADQKQSGNIRPASEDPYGDPADSKNT